MAPSSSTTPTATGVPGWSKVQAGAKNWSPMKPKTKSSGAAEGQPIAVVVGARRDIGTALVKTLSARGYFVVAECGKYAAEKLGQHEGVCCVRSVDMSTSKGVEKLRSVVGLNTPVDLLIVNTAANPTKDLGLSSDELVVNMNQAYQSFVLVPALTVHAFGSQLRSGAKVAIFCSTSGSFASMSPSSQQMFMPGHSLNTIAAMSALESVVMHLEAWLKSRNATLSFVHPGLVHEELFSGANAQEIESRGNNYGMVLTEDEVARVCLERVLKAVRQSPTMKTASLLSPPATLKSMPQVLSVEIPEDISASMAPSTGSQKSCSVTPASEVEIKQPADEDDKHEADSPKTPPSLASKEPQVSNQEELPDVSLQESHQASFVQPANSKADTAANIAVPVAA